MTAPNPCHDAAIDVVSAFTVGMREAFDPDGVCPPDGKGGNDVRFFAGDGELPASMIPQGPECNPLLWVRVAHRYRSTVATFPDPFTKDSPCSGAGGIRVLAVEIGVGRCSTMEADPDWDVLEDEAIVSLDDSMRIEKVLCTVSNRLRTKTRAVGTDTVAPYGPVGGIIAWTGMAYVQF